MERRWSKRKTMEREVHLRYEGVGMMRCQIADLSFEGTFIKTGDFVIPQDVELDITFDAAEIDEASVRFGGRVVRVQADGVGVHFKDYHEGAYRFLRQVLT